MPKSYVALEKMALEAGLRKNPPIVSWKDFMHMGRMCGLEGKIILTLFWPMTCANDTSFFMQASLKRNCNNTWKLLPDCCTAWDLLCTLGQTLS